MISVILLKYARRRGFINHALPNSQRAGHKNSRCTTDHHAAAIVCLIAFDGTTGKGNLGAFTNSHTAAFLIDCITGSSCSICRDNVILNQTVIDLSSRLSGNTNTTTVGNTTTADVRCCNVFKNITTIQVDAVSLFFLCRIRIECFRRIQRDTTAHVRLVVFNVTAGQVHRRRVMNCNTATGRICGVVDHITAVHFNSAFTENGNTATGASQRNIRTSGSNVFAGGAGSAVCVLRCADHTA